MKYSFPGLKNSPEAWVTWTWYVQHTNNRKRTDETGSIDIWKKKSDYLGDKDEALSDGGAEEAQDGTQGINHATVTPQQTQQRDD